MIVSGFGPKAVALAARIGDGYWGTAPNKEIVDRYRQSGGAGPRYAQMHICWDEDERRARKTVHRVWPNAGITGQLSQDLPTWVHFEEAAAMVSEDEATSSVPCGPSVEPVVESVRQYLNAGYDHVYFHQIDLDQHGYAVRHLSGSYCSTTARRGGGIVGACGQDIEEGLQWSA